MTAPRLQILRSQLAGLRQARATSRQLTAWAAVGIAVLWSLVVLFVLDFAFQREIQSAQRVILMLVAAGAVTWAFRRYASPLLAVQESDVDMALMVERQQQIESDLVAAIQFEDDVEGRWGSRELETAVIEYVAQLGPDIDVYQGLDRSQQQRRLTILGVTAAAIAIAGLLFPAYLAAFANRLALGARHYPSGTQIKSLAVNGRNVLTNGMLPENIRCAEGREVEFILRCEGNLPEQGLAHLSARQRFERTEVEITPLSSEDRLARLQKAQAMVTEAQASPSMDLAGPWFEDLAALVQFESPEQWNALGLDPAALSASQLADQVQQQLKPLQELVDGLVSKGAVTDTNTALFVGQLPRLNEPVRYRITLGDAYTDTAEITMIALPAVEARLTPVPPKYAAKALAAEQAGRQAAVLMGSDVQVAIECTNKKSLQQVWMTVRPVSGSEARRFDLQADNEARTQWSLAAAGTPFQEIREELRYEIQVTDEDGLHLETPIKGSVRIRVDKPPVAVAASVHRVVTPGAKPSIQYRAGDDFGLQKLALEVQVERQVARNRAGNSTDSSESASSSDTSPAEEVKLETTEFNLLPSSPVTLERLPLASKAAINLSALKLDPGRGPIQKGDRLKVVLVAEDDRGELKGETFRSEAIIIEISDDLGVLSAVGEADPQAAQRLDEILKREFGIGESP